MAKTLSKYLAILWAATVTAVLFSSVSLIGLIVSKNKYIKETIIEELKKNDIFVQDFDIRFFPLSDDIIEISVVGFEKGNLAVDYFSISLRRVLTKGLSLPSLYCEVCEVLPGVKTKIKANGVRISIPTEEEQTTSLRSICNIEKIYRVKASKLLYPFSISSQFSDILLQLGNGKISSKRAELHMGLEDATIAFDYLVDLDEADITDSSIRLPNLSGAILLVANFKMKEGKGYATFREPVIGSGNVSLSMCRDVLLSINYSLSVTTDLSAFSGIFENLEGMVSISSTGKMTILKDDEFRLSGNINGFGHKLSISDQSIKDIVFDTSYDFDGKKVDFSSRIGSENTELFIEGYYTSEKGLNAKFSGNIEFGDLPFIGVVGRAYAYGKIEFPHALKSKVKLYSIYYSPLKFDEGEGSLELSNGEIAFDLNLAHKNATINWKGKYNLHKGVLSSCIGFLSSSIGDIIDALGIDLPVDGLGDGEAHLELLENKLRVFGNLSSYDSIAFGEKLLCLSADFVSEFDLVKGDVNVFLRGIGGEREPLCKSKTLSSYDDSVVYYDVKVDEVGFNVSLSGVYDLSKFDMLGVGLRGKASFEGKISGRYEGDMQGKITLLAGDVSFAEYPLRTSCIEGAVLLSEADVQFDGKSCEGFSISSTYNFVSSEFSLSLVRNNTAVVMRNNSISGIGRLEDISLVIPYLRGNTGTFDFSYDILKGNGKVNVGSHSFNVGDFEVGDLNFSGEITNNNMTFFVSGLYSGERFWGGGDYSISRRKLYSKLYLRNFAGIPVSGNLIISGQIDNLLYLSGNFRVSNVEISEEKIKEITKGEVGVYEEIGQDTEIEVEGKGPQNVNLNVKIDLEDVVYRSSLIKLNLDGSLYVVGAAKKPRVFGVLNIEDGLFGLADTEFSNIEGVAFVRDDKIFVNVSASTNLMTFEGEKFLITVRIVGDVRSPKVYLSSVPQISQSDILCVLAVYRRCKSLDEFNKIMASIIYRNFSLISETILEKIETEESFRIIISPSDVGMSRRIGEFEITIMQNIFEEIRRFIASRSFREGYQFILSWDNRRYGYSILGDIGNIGLDVKTRRRF